ncbi:RsmE family RNA methyltransferase [Terrimonas rubra]|uniref:Ribosomal RNA small subunit methyltransferase E n=1 Tax=Terrimonas rubra TaxID=1035890 RepID=A0ABW6A6W9_9BACT
MSIPFFYYAHYQKGQRQITLDEDTSKHIVQVLRMVNGEAVNLTDGKGHLLECSITEAHKKHCTVAVNTTGFTAAPLRQIHIAIGLLKNANRWEWFLEKATEIGVSHITPLLTKRTEKDKFRYDRMQTICISAMLQSQQVWLPVLQEPVGYDKFITAHKGGLQLIAHCEEGQERQQLAAMLIPDGETTLLIGPEGDFTVEEIALALEQQYKAVSLGATRLRTETAGIVGAALLCVR